MNNKQKLLIHICLNQRFYCVKSGGACRLKPHGSITIVMATSCHRTLITPNYIPNFKLRQQCLPTSTFKLGGTTSKLNDSG